MFAVGVWTDVRPEPGVREGRRRYAELLEEVSLADELGYDVFGTPEQHAVDDGHHSSQLTLIAGLGTATRRIRFMTNILLVLLHPWRQVVEDAIVADLLTGGRLALGLGAGGYAREFQLFGVDFKRRGALMEEALSFLRMGLSTGELPDGPGGSKLPVLPLPVQQPVPLFLGGVAPRAIDRAVRLADGAVPVDFFQPEEEFPAFWATKLAPALERHQRSLDDFRFIACTQLWATEDPERDWELFYRRAIEYQFEKYREWAGDRAMVGVRSDSPAPWRRETMLIDTPDSLVTRLTAMRERAPFDELMFSYRIPHIGHERALHQLQFFHDRVLKRLGRGSSTAPPEAQSA